MLHPSTRKLVEKLYNLTVEHRIAWIENSRGNGVYVADSYEVEVSADPCEFRIRRVGGHDLEVAGLTDLCEMQTDDGRSYDRIVRELAVDSVRIASGLEQAIACLGETLDRSGDQDGPTYPESVRDHTRQIVDFAGATQKRSLLQQKRQANDGVSADEGDQAEKDTGTAERDYSTWT